MIRILHVDDEADFLFLSKKILERSYGFEVFTADNAKNCLSLLQTESFDALISDYMLPDMDGLSLLQAIRNSGNTIPFIFCTGRGREDVVIDAINRGADYYLQKGGDAGVLFAELAYKINKAVHHQRTEEGLRKSEEKYRRIVETIREGIWHVNRDGETVFVNRRMAEMLGYEVDEMTGSRSSSYLFPEDIPGHQEMMDERFQGVSKTYEHRFLRKDGTVLWALISGTPVYENGQVTGSFGTVTDITDQKRNEDAIRNSEIEFRTLFENTRAATLIFEEDALITRVNKAFVMLWGHDHDEIEHKKRWTEFIHPDDLGYMQTYHEDRVKNPDSVPSVYEFRFIDSEGDIHHILANVGLIPGTSRRIASLLDITAQKKIEADLRSKTAELQASYEQLASAEEILRKQYDEISQNEMALQESFNLYRAIFENTGNASVIIEGDYGISLANTGWEHLSGYKKEEIEGRMRYTEFIPPEDLSRIQEYHRLRRVHPGDAPGIYESRFLMRCGEIRDVITHVAMIPGTKKSIASLLDITERKKAEDAVRASEKKYRELFGNITDGVILYQILPDGKAGRILEANRVMEEWLSLPVDLMKEKTPDEICSACSFLDPLASLHQGGNYLFSSELHGEDGKRIPVEVHLRIIAHEGGDAGLAVLHDITDRMKFEGERNVLLQQIERNLGELSILNDGIRNPLTVMMILAEETESRLSAGFCSQIDKINEMVDNLDKRWIESEKVLRFLRRHYDIGRYVPSAPGCRPDRDP